MAKFVFLAFHSLTTIAAIAAAIGFFMFYMQAQDSVNLIGFFPALIVAGILILNSYFMYLGHFRTRYFTAMRTVTIIGGLFSFLALIVVAKSFGHSTSGLLAEIVSIPKFFISNPIGALIYGFPFLSAGTAISSFFVARG